MNIDQEREAFKAALIARLTARSVRQYGEQSRERAHTAASRYIATCGYIESEFDIWIAAKEHAAEMLKPVVTIAETLGDEWGVYRPDHDLPIERHGSKEDAIEWVIANGYRVVK